jgi:hypothetical protein
MGNDNELLRRISELESERTRLLRQLALATSGETITREQAAAEVERLLTVPFANASFLEGVRRAALKLRAGRLTTPVDGGDVKVDGTGAAGDKCEHGNECGRTGCPNCQD